MRPQTAGSADGSRFRHAPEMLDLQAETIELTNQFEGRRGAANQDANRFVDSPAARIFFQSFENGDPDGRNATGNGDAFIDKQIEDAFGIDIWPGENEARAEHGASVRQAPGVGMEHRSNGQDGVELAYAKDFVKAAAERVQHQRSMRINNAFGIAGGAGGEAHRGAVVFVDRRITKIIARFGKQLFIIQEAFRYGGGTVGHDDHTLGRNMHAMFLVKRQEHIVNQDKAVVGMPGDGGNFMWVKPQVQGVQNATGAGNAEESFQVAGVIPHHGSHAVTRLQAEFRQSRGEPAGAAVEFAITPARNGLIGSAGDNLDARKKLSRALQNGGERERKIHHRAAHKASWAGQIGRMLPLIG